MGEMDAPTFEAAEHPLLKVIAAKHYLCTRPLIDCSQLPAIREFDAFPKTLPSYKSRSSRGGLATLALCAIIAGLVWVELKEYLYGEPLYSFAVDRGIGHALQINFDMTVAMPCHCEYKAFASKTGTKRLTYWLLVLTVDVRDAVGDRLHISEEFAKDGVLMAILKC